MKLPTQSTPSDPGSRTIRVSHRVYQRLGELSRRREATISETIADLIDEQEKRDFFARLRDGYAALRADPAAWDETRAELQAWDATLGDGLEHD